MERLEKRYSIAEIFYSVQGEGFHTGKPMVFVRFAGCNRACEFCDTDHGARHHMTANQILSCADSLAPHMKNRILCLTGGEPLLQVDVDLTFKAVQAGWRIHIETNGTIDTDIAFDWITVSPKDGLPVLKFGDELKVVFGMYDDEMMKQFEQCLHGTAGVFDHLYVQPMSEGNIAQAVEFVKRNTRWRLSIQTQKTGGFQ